MSYQDKIQQYNRDQMTELERFVFEQELEENPQLKKSLVASTLVEDLLTVTSSSLTEQQILDNSTIINNKPTNKNKWYLALGGLLLFGIASLSFFDWNQNTTSNSNIKVEEVPVPEATKPAVTIPLKENTPIENAVKETNSPKKAIKAPEKAKPKQEVAGKKEPIPYAATTPTSKTPKLFEQTEKQENIGVVTLEPGFSVAKNQSFEAAIKEGQPMASLNSEKAIESVEIVNKGQSVTYAAGNSIVLKPGFHVKAGATFTAAIESGGE